MCQLNRTFYCMTNLNDLVLAPSDDSDQPLQCVCVCVGGRGGGDLWDLI